MITPLFEVFHFLKMSIKISHINIGKIIKILGIIIGIIVILILIIFIYTYNDSKKREKEQEKVKMSIEYNLKKCNEDYPLFITIENNTDKTINNINFDLKITRRGHSTDIGDYTDYNSDLIMGPGKAFGNCYLYRLKNEYKKYNNPADLQFEISYKHVYFLGK